MMHSCMLPAFGVIILFKLIYFQCPRSTTSRE